MTTDIKVPDIGDFKDVGVIEVLVKPGDTVKVEQSLITIESDKASMEIPSSHAGVVKEIKVKIGDTVNQGSVILSLDEAAQGASATPAAPAAPSPSPASAPAPVAAAAPAPAPTAMTAAPAVAPGASFGGDLSCDLLVLGAGPGGYSAAFRAADLGLKVVLVERYATLGGVCLNVGCIPSKAMLHVAAVLDEVAHFDKVGVSFGAPSVDRGKLVAHKNKVVGRLTGGLAQMAKMRKVTVVTGTGRFSDDHHASVELAAGGTTTIGFARAVIAAGSEAVKLPFMPKDDRRVVTSTGALELDAVPGHLVVIGGGVIGLELGSVWRRLGAKVTVIEFLDGILPGMDSEIRKQFERILAKQGMKFRLKSKVTAAKADATGVTLTVEPAAGGTAEEIRADVVLLSIGRRPFVAGLGLEAVGVALDERGRVKTDAHYATNVPGTYAIGDAIAGPMLAHKAEEEGSVLAEMLAGQKPHINYNAIPGVVYTWPEVAAVGETEEQLKARGQAYKVGKFPFMANGRARAMGEMDGFVKLIADKDTDKLLGAHIIGPDAGTLIAELALAIEFGASAEDIARTSHAHPSLNEAVKEAALAVGGRALHI